MPNASEIPLTFRILHITMKQQQKKKKEKKRKGHIYHFFLMQNIPAKLNDTFDQEMNGDLGPLKNIHS